MDTSHRPLDARKFVLWGVAASLGLFAGLRLPWIENTILLPLTRMQGDLATALFGTPALPVQITLACSGAEAVALCVGAILAYPVAWRARLTGAVGGIALILTLNTLRIGTLGLVTDSPASFAALHEYVWPALLTLAVAGYVLAWMRVAERTKRHPATNAVTPSASVERAWQPSRRFILLASALLIVFAVASPIYLESPIVVALGGVIASAAAAILLGVGVSAHATANVLATSRGAFVVTQECISTPLIPVYLAAVCTYAAGRRSMVVGIFATLPLVTALGVVRLLLVAVPAAVVDSPTFLVHAFYQLLLGAVVVFLAATWRHGRRAAPVYTAAGVAAGVVFVLLLGPAYTSLVTTQSSRAIDDPQGAIAFLPAFQVGLYLALWVAALFAARWPRLVTGLGLLAFTQVAGLLALQALAVAGFAAQVRDVRAWAVAGPVVIFATVVHRARANR